MPAGTAAARCAARQISFFDLLLQVRRTVGSLTPPLEKNGGAAHTSHIWQTGASGLAERFLWGFAFLQNPEPPPALLVP